MINHHHHCFLPMRLMFVDQSSRFQPRRSPTLYFPSLRSQTAALPLCSSLQTWCSVAWIILVLTQYRLYNRSILCCVCVICTTAKEEHCWNSSPMVTEWHPASIPGLCLQSNIKPQTEILHCWYAMRGWYAKGDMKCEAGPYFASHCNQRGAEHCPGNGMQPCPANQPMCISQWVADARQSVIIILSRHGQAPPVTQSNERWTIESRGGRKTHFKHWNNNPH